MNAQNYNYWLNLLMQFDSSHLPSNSSLNLTPEQFSHNLLLQQQLSTFTPSLQFQKNISDKILASTHSQNSKFSSKKNLTPSSSSRKPWTKEEDITLLEKYNELGTNWKKIKQFLPHRALQALKSRFYRVIVKKYQVQLKSDLKLQAYKKCKISPHVITTEDLMKIQTRFEQNNIEENDKQKALNKLYSKYYLMQLCIGNLKSQLQDCKKSPQETISLQNPITEPNFQITFQGSQQSIHLENTNDILT